VFIGGKLIGGADELEKYFAATSRRRVRRASDANAKSMSR
jgi:hypothetical protein